MVSVSESICYFLRKGMYVHDSKQLCAAGENSFLRIVELILIRIVELILIRMVELILIRIVELILIRIVELILI